MLTLKQLYELKSGNIIHDMWTNEIYILLKEKTKRNSSSEYVYFQVFELTSLIIANRVINLKDEII